MRDITSRLDNVIKSKLLGKSSKYYKYISLYTPERCVLESILKNTNMKMLKRKEHEKETVSMFFV